jgi:ppGpp synthetase/RelA/SpoT-type nucleotidyltranferase
MCEQARAADCRSYGTEKPGRWVVSYWRVAGQAASLGIKLLDSTIDRGLWWESMAWGARIFSKGRIDRAGQALLDLPQDCPEREEEIGVVDNWRACHAYPLQIIKMTLFRRARKIDPSALIAQRLKRRPSIEIKLRDNPNMSLSQMQDIGGCRAVLSTVGQVRKLVDKYKQFHAKSPKNRSDWDGSDDFDYISHPKPDGYRSIHLVFRFQSPSTERAIYNGQRIEIQIRSKLQHLWATAVETAQIFTGQALKSKVKNASEDWLRFFSLTSSAFALREKSPIVPGTPDDRAEIVRQVRDIIGRTDIMASLSNWNDTVHLLEDRHAPDAYFYLLILDSEKRTLNVEPFKREEAVKSQRAYDKAEKYAEGSPNTQVVLVSVEDVEALRRAYPNYYVDTKGFIAAVEREMGTGK